MARRGYFYEDDEPIEKLEAAFERGQQVVSASRAVEQGWNARIVLTGVQPTPPEQLGSTRAAVRR